MNKQQVISPEDAEAERQAHQARLNEQKKIEAGKRKMGYAVLTSAMAVVAAVGVMFLTAYLGFWPAVTGIAAGIAIVLGVLLTFNATGE